MLLWVLRERKNSEMESLTLDQSQRQNEETWRDTRLYLKLEWSNVTRGVEASFENFVRHKIASNLLCLVPKSMFRQAAPSLSHWCCPHFMRYLSFAGSQDPRQKHIGPFSLVGYGTIPSLAACHFLVFFFFFFPWFTGYVYSLVGQRRAWP